MAPTHRDHCSVMENITEGVNPINSREMSIGTKHQIHDRTVSQRKLGSGWLLAIACFMARSSAKLASISRIVPMTCMMVTRTNTFTEKRFIV